VNGFLARVTAQKRDEIAAGRAAHPLSELRRICADLPACRGLRGAVTAGPDRIIAEVKGRSPSRGRFPRPESPAQLAAAYHDAGAAALSLVTDASNFGTRAADIEPMRAAARLPLLAKDFIIDPWQILRLRAAGADGVLLIVRLLGGDGRLADLRGQALEAGMDALVECHDETDLTRALAAGSDVVGLNNRDLETFVTSLDVSRRLLPQVPAGCAAVVESGLHRRSELVELQGLGAAAFLIGGTLLEGADPARRLRELRGAA
jgi:indole-3-glycerol phosphate synthase